MRTVFASFVLLKNIPIVETPKLEFPKKFFSKIFPMTYKRDDRPPH